MSIPTVSINDFVNQFISSFNTLAEKVGDLTLLQSEEDSNIVAAINSLIGQAGVDSSATIPLARASISVIDSGGDGQLSYNSLTGVITYRGPSAAEVRSKFSAVSPLSVDSLGVYRITDASTAAKGAARFDSSNFSAIAGLISIKAGGVTSSALAANSVGFTAMADSAVGSNELRQAVQLIIYNSAGTPVKTLYGAGE